MHILLPTFILTQHKKRSELVNLPMSSVSEIMSEKEIATVVADTGKSAQDVAQMMVKKKVGSIIIIDRRSHPIGIVTERDIVKRVCLKDVAASRIRLEEIVTIMSYDSVDTASRIMVKNNIKRLVVLEEDNRIVGLLSVTDITRRLAKILLDDYSRYRSLRFAVDLAGSSLSPS
jgi:signal-transduction protein with cAMP-binding, CBS, and nucleotidyltransferase domain